MDSILEFRNQVGAAGCAADHPHAAAETHSSIRPQPIARFLPHETSTVDQPQLRDHFSASGHEPILGDGRIPLPN